MNNLPPVTIVTPWVKCKNYAGLGGTVHARLNGDCLELTGVVRDLPASNDVIRKLVYLPPEFNIKRMLPDGGYANATTSIIPQTSPVYLQCTSTILEADLGALRNQKVSWVIVNATLSVEIK